LGKLGGTARKLVPVKCFYAFLRRVFLFNLKYMEKQDLLHNKRHSLAHVLATAVLELYPEAQLAIGPVIDTGCYYDFDNLTLKESDLPKIEKKMRGILTRGGAVTSWVLPIAEALAKEEVGGSIYKAELIRDLQTAGETEVSYYKIGVFEDLCKGPHVENLSEIAGDSFCLTKLAGAYWRGNEKNKMLTRIYVAAFDNKTDLDAYLNMMVEAEKRDHRKLGKELKLFTVSELVGSGLPMMQPKGMIIRQAIADYLWELHKDKGYDRVWTPHLAKPALYETSGHAAKFGDELFKVQGKEESFFLKPMNCPHHMQIFADNQWSYRDLPIRYFEPATIYRDEKTGQLAGLTRVRAITQDDGHLFCRVDQIETEVSIVVGVIREFYTTMGMLENYWVRLSTRGDDHSKYLGSDEVWSLAENALEKSAKENDLPYRLGPGEAAFYGPKLDFMFKDSIGREWQLATIQCDFNLPERFDLSFVNAKGEKERPVVIHRAISGSLERFMGIIIEHFGGNFPLWLTPVQVKLVAVSETHIAYCQELANRFKRADIRVEVDTSNETVGNKIRKAVNEKVSHMLVIGDKELASSDLQVRDRGSRDTRSISYDDFITELQDKIAKRSLT